VRASYLAAPPLVVLYALAGRFEIDIENDPIQHMPNGRAVYARDLLPNADELDKFIELVGHVPALPPHADVGVALWDKLNAPSGARFPWSAASLSLLEPPFYEPGVVPALSDSIEKVRCLAAFTDSITTDHISPGGEIDQDSPAARWLSEHGVEPSMLGSYISRRGNHHVMVRGTYANRRICNVMADGRVGPWTCHVPSGDIISIHEASERYRREDTPLIVLAGHSYGTGSSRDWAAKGPAMLGIRCVLAGSFERIHRANLVDMGIAPLQFLSAGWSGLGLTGHEEFTLKGVRSGIKEDRPITVVAKSNDGRTLEFLVRAQLNGAAERRLLLAGGLPGQVLQRLLQL
jgi:aconitate hydratase